jgi:hypothetical protein
MVADSSAPMSVYDVHGLRMRSALVLPAPITEEPAAVDVAVGEPFAAPWERPSADVLAELIGPDGWPRYSFCRLADGSVRARFYSLADFHIDSAGGAVVCHTHPEVPPGVTAVLVAGSIASFLMMSAGTCVLHASAVEIAPHAAVALVGPTARGKTTTAALLCAGGGALVTDDVLPVRMRGGEPMCGTGNDELRLRPQQSALVDLFTDQPLLRHTADGRIAVRPRRTASREPALKAIVHPRPDREGAAFSVQRLSTMEAVSLLVSVPRIEGWRAPDRVAGVFTHAVDLAERLPVVEVSIPWGPPFPTDVIPQLRQVLNTVIEG